MHLDIPHKFPSQEAAVAKVKQALDEGRSKLDGKATIEEERWDGDTLNFGVNIQGQSIAGTLAV